MTKVSTESSNSARFPLLLYDGVCGFCNRSVQIVLKHDAQGRIHFAPLQSNLAQSLLGHTPELKEIDSLIFLEEDDDGQVKTYFYSSAVIRIARYLRYPWRLFTIAGVIPRRVRDFFYRLFAQNRYRLFGRSDSCAIPPANVRSRFLDWPQSERTSSNVK